MSKRNNGLVFSSCCGAFDLCQKKTGPAEAQGIATDNVRLFSYNSLRSATRNFHPSNKIGRGGFGVVYKGVLRDGTEVAIKCLSAESKQGTKEFLTELYMISNIRHPNLVQLIGCCVEGNDRILVYEYMENNSLASALLGSNDKRIELDWAKRAAICLGTASGLAFLHEDADPPIVHRDIKASNLLLDESFLPKIGDFGLAKLFPDNVTHVSTRVAGTVGYLAPEYAMLGQLTRKADVYSFGVLLLEIISGKSSSKSAFGENFSSILEWVGFKFMEFLYLTQKRIQKLLINTFADLLLKIQFESLSQTWELLNEGRLLEIVDPDLEDYPEGEVMRFTKVALFCTQATSQQRPDMKQVVRMLSTDVILNEKLLTEPGIFRPQHSGKSSGGSLQFSSQRNKEKQSVVVSNVEDPHAFTEMLPR